MRTGPRRRTPQGTGQGVEYALVEVEVLAEAVLDSVARCEGGTDLTGGLGEAVG